jgi:hypothetical protein
MRAPGPRLNAALSTLTGAATGVVTNLMTNAWSWTLAAGFTALVVTATVLAVLAAASSTVVYDVYGGGRRVVYRGPIRNRLRSLVRRLRAAWKRAAQRCRVRAEEARARRERERAARKGPHGCGTLLAAHPATVFPGIRRVASPTCPESVDAARLRAAWAADPPEHPDTAGFQPWRLGQRRSGGDPSSCATSGAWVRSGRRPAAPSRGAAGGGRATPGRVCLRDDWPGADPPPGERWVAE